MSATVAIGKVFKALKLVDFPDRYPPTFSMEVDHDFQKVSSLLKDHVQFPGKKQQNMCVAIIMET